MIYCPKCGWKNEDDTQYCTKCGNNLVNEKNDYNKNKTEITSFEKQVEKFAENVEQTGKKAGKKIEQSVKKLGEETQDFGKKIEKITKKTRTSFEGWYNRTLGIFGPLISSLIGIIIIRIVIEALKIGAKDTLILADVGEALLSNLLLFFVVFLIANYTEYLIKKYHSIRWITPISIAFVVAIVSLIVKNIITVVGTAIGETELAVVTTEGIKKYLLMIFILIILAGYLILIAKVYYEKNQSN